MEGHWSDFERAGVERALRYSFVGSAETVRRGLEAFIELTGADEIMAASQIFDHRARLRSFELLAGAFPSAN
jgi:alkanesulfonate monooxygenase SsuD/methylene tetrahydromethanopterin reductase-like flavin-dependent oxidoreductase (luciferase family)